MSHWSALQILIGFYAGTLVVNIIVSSIQYYSERNPVQRMLLFYWLGIFVTALVNQLVKDFDLAMVLVGSLGTFVSQVILGQFVTKARGVRFALIPLLGTFALCAIVSWILSLAGLGFAVSAFPAVFGAALPGFVSCYLVLKKREPPLTSTQKMFLLTFLVMSVHYLDWSYFKTQPQLFMVGMVIAFGLLHVLSILAAMLANEHALLTRNQLLEKEVRARAEELASTKEQLLESNKLATIGRMAGGIAHELNNPLAILSLNVEQLQRFAKKGILSVESVLKESSSIEKVISRIAGITSSLRNVARDNATDERRVADLRTVIGDTLPFCAERMKGLGIEFQTEMPAHACPIVCNSGALSQVTMNLLSNAIDAVADRQIKEIRLCLIQKENSFEISVEDSGILDQAILSSIMEPFFTTKPIGKGVGLGLSVSRSLAEAHSGKLYVDTTADRTRFVLTLPRLPEVGAQDV